jgi:hypothetical protein
VVSSENGLKSQDECPPQSQSLVSVAIAKQLGVGSSEDQETGVIAPSPENACKII